MYYYKRIYMTAIIPNAPDCPAATTKSLLSSSKTRHENIMVPASTTKSSLTRFALDNFFLYRYTLRNRVGCSSTR